MKMEFDRVKLGFSICPKIDEVQIKLDKLRKKLNTLDVSRSGIIGHTRKQPIKNKGFLAFVENKPFKEIKVLGEKNGLLIVMHKDQWNENYVYSAFPISKHKKRLVAFYHGDRDRNTWMGWRKTIKEIMETFKWLEREYNYKRLARKPLT